MKRALTCIVCPMGCKMEVILQSNQVVSVSGNGCPRGKAYALEECTHPSRVLTTTMATTSGRLVPVRTDRPVAKDCLMDCMKKINRATAKTPVRLGQVLLSDVDGQGADVIATQSSQ